jgi:hypothetical protein
MGIPLDLFTPIFAIARVTGWTAHIMEQHKNNRIIRPTDDLRGPMGLKVEPIEKRGIVRAESRGCARKRWRVSALRRGVARRRAAS